MRWTKVDLPAPAMPMTMIAIAFFLVSAMAEAEMCWISQPISDHGEMDIKRFRSFLFVPRQWKKGMPLPTCLAFRE